MPRGSLRLTNVGFLAGIFLFSSLGSLAQQAATTQSISSRGEISFPDQKRWLGADDAYSIPLEDGRSLWLFGDTFIGAMPESPRTAKSAFIRNSIGISTCSAGKCTIEYFWANMNSDKPDSMFSVPGTDWFWPMDGFVYKGTLYITMMQMHAVKDGGPMGFDFSGTTVAIIPNYTAPPDQWKISYKSLNVGGKALPGVSIILGQGKGGNPDPENPNGANFLYVFTLVQGDKPMSQHLGLLRLPLTQLNAIARPGGAAWEYLRANSTWAKWADAEKVLPNDHANVLQPGATEMSVRYHDSTKQWIAVYPSFGMKTAEYAVSDSMTHGWQPGKTLYTYPEAQPTHPNYTKNVFCYAAKEHVELEAEGQLVFTYACNSFQESELFDKTQLYRPIVVTKPLPKD
jgi:hypothetical protein